MPWGSILGGIGGSAVSGLLGGDDDDPVKRYRRFLAQQIYGINGQGGINEALSRDADSWKKFYKSSVFPAIRGKYGQDNKAINLWEADQNANTDQSRAARGLYNTSLVDDDHTAAGESAQRMRLDSRQAVDNELLGAKMDLKGIGQGFKDRRYNNILSLSASGPAMFDNSAWQQQRGQNAAAFGGAISSILNWRPGPNNQTPRDPGMSFPSAVPSFGSQIWQYLNTLFSGSSQPVAG